MRGATLQSLFHVFPEAETRYISSPRRLFEAMEILFSPLNPCAFILLLLKELHIFQSAHYNRLLTKAAL